jgi:hypothetical protein
MAWSFKGRKIQKETIGRDYRGIGSDTKRNLVDTKVDLKRKRAHVRNCKAKAAVASETFGFLKWPSNLDGGKHASIKLNAGMRLGNPAALGHSLNAGIRNHMSLTMAMN